MLQIVPAGEGVVSFVAANNVYTYCNIAQRNNLPRVRRQLKFSRERWTVIDDYNKLVHDCKK